MGQLSHLAAYGAEVLNRDGGAARTQIRPQVTLAASRLVRTAGSVALRLRQVDADQWGQTLSPAGPEQLQPALSRQL